MSLTLRAVLANRQALIQTDSEKGSAQNLYLTTIIENIKSMTAKFNRIENQYYELVQKNTELEQQNDRIERTLNKLENDYNKHDELVRAYDIIALNDRIAYLKSHLITNDFADSEINEEVK